MGQTANEIAEQGLGCGWSFPGREADSGDGKDTDHVTRGVDEEGGIDAPLVDDRSNQGRANDSADVDSHVKVGHGVEEGTVVDQVGDHGNPCRLVEGLKGAEEDPGQIDVPNGDQAGGGEGG